jgi:hypothetical protein
MEFPLHKELVRMEIILVEKLFMSVIIRNKNRIKIGTLRDKSFLERAIIVSSLNLEHYLGKQMHILRSRYTEMKQ